MSQEAAPRSTVIVLVIGMMAISFAAILIRYAQGEGVPSLYIAAFRLLGAALLLTIPALWRYRGALRGLSLRDWGLAVLSGFFLAAHFAFWNLSLEYTTVLVSVTLVSTTPIWAVLLEWIFLRQVPRAMVILGMAIAIGGGLFLAIPSGGSSGFAGGTNPVLGGVLALLGALAVAVYLTIGRKLRADLALVPYIWIVYGIGGLSLLLVLVVTGVPLVGYSAAGYGWLVALAVIPQLIGHSALNYAVKYMSATYISVLTKLEPIVSAIIAYFAFAEVPSVWEVLGSVFILVGVVVASLRQQRRATKIPATVSSGD